MLSPLDNAQLSGHSSCGSGGRLDTPQLSHRELPPAPESHNINSVSLCSIQQHLHPLDSDSSLPHLVGFSTTFNIYLRTRLGPFFEMKSSVFDEAF